MNTILRKAKIGQTLYDSLHEMEEKKLVTPSNSEEILKIFDEVITKQFDTNQTTKGTIKGSLHNYQNCDNVWKFVLQDVKLSCDSNNTRSLDATEIITVDYKGLAGGHGARNKKIKSGNASRAQSTKKKNAPQENTKTNKKRERPKDMKNPDL